MDARGEKSDVRVLGCVIVVGLFVAGCVDTVIKISQRNWVHCWRLCKQELLHTGVDYLNGEVTCTCKDHRRFRIERIDDYFHDNSYD